DWRAEGERLAKEISQAALGDSKDLQAGEDALNELIAKDKAQRTDLQAKWRRDKDALAEGLKGLEEAKVTLRSLQAQKAQIEKLTGKCPTCRQPMTEEHRLITISEIDEAMATQEAV